MSRILTEPLKLLLQKSAQLKQPKQLNAARYEIGFSEPTQAARLRHAERLKGVTHCQHSLCRSKLPEGHKRIYCDDRCKKNAHNYKKYHRRKRGEIS